MGGATGPTPPRRPRSADSVSARGCGRFTSGVFGVVFLVAFEAMAVATAMPVAVKDLDGLPLYGWAFSAFLVTSLFSTVVAGELSDARGPRLPLLGGIAAFSVGLVVAGLAPTMPVFILGRALQGLGAGGVVVALYVVVARAYPETQRPQMFALMSAGWVLPSLVGPTIAGALADHLSWRWVFLGVPILVLPAVALVAPWLGRLEGGHGAGGRRGRKRAALATAVAVALLQYPGTRLDWVSVPLALLAVALLVPTLPRLLPAGALRLARGLPTAVAMRGFLRGSLLRRRDVPPAGPHQRARPVHDAGRALADRWCPRLGGRVVPAGSPGPRAAALAARPRRLRLRRDRHRLAGCRAGPVHPCRRGWPRVGDRWLRHGHGHGVGVGRDPRAVTDHRPRHQLGGAPGERRALLDHRHRRRLDDLRGRPHGSR